MNAAGNPGAKPAGLAIRVAIWVAQLLLIALFGYTGFIKITWPITELARTLVWPGAIPPALVRFIGLCELGASLGLLLPSVTRVLPILSPIAAIGLATIMALAIPFHISRGEANVIPLHLVLGGLAVFVAWGRLKLAPIPARH
jgi:putative oxidoreductase